MFAATLLFAAFVIQLVPDVSDAARDTRPHDPTGL